MGKIEAPGTLGMVLLPCLFLLLGINTVVERPFLKLGQRLADRTAFARAPGAARLPA